MKFRKCSCLCQPQYLTDKIQVLSHNRKSSYTNETLFGKWTPESNFR